MTARIAGALTGIALFSVMAFHGQPEPSRPKPPAVPAELVSPVAGFASFQPVYSHAVFPHGIHTAVEFAEILEANPDRYPGATVAADFTTTPKGMFAYVTYARDGHIFWTKNKIFLPAETPVILTNGLMILQRCGNMVSPIPSVPVEVASDPYVDQLEGGPIDPSVLAEPVSVPVLPATAFVPAAPTVYTGGPAPYYPSVWIPGVANPAPVATPEPSLLFMALSGIGLMLAGGIIRAKS